MVLTHTDEVAIQLFAEEIAEDYPDYIKKEIVEQVKAVVAEVTKVKKYTYEITERTDKVGNVYRMLIDDGMHFAILRASSLQNAVSEKHIDHDPHFYPPEILFRVVSLMKKWVKTVTPLKSHIKHEGLYYEAEQYVTIGTYGFIALQPATHNVVFIMAPYLIGTTTQDHIFSVSKEVRINDKYDKEE